MGSTIRPGDDNSQSVPEQYSPHPSDNTLPSGPVSRSGNITSHPKDLSQDNIELTNVQSHRAPVASELSSERRPSPSAFIRGASRGGPSDGGLAAASRSHRITVERDGNDKLERDDERSPSGQVRPHVGIVFADVTLTSIRSAAAPR
jgi:hypothetical protein